MSNPDRLAGYEARTQEALDLLALASMWLAVVVASEFGAGHRVRAIV